MPDNNLNQGRLHEEIRRLKNELSQFQLNEKKLKEDLEKYKALFYLSNEAFMLFDTQRGFISANNAAVKLFGCKNEADFLSHTLLELSPQIQPDGQLSRKKFKDIMLQVMKSGTMTLEWTHMRVNGKEFEALVSINRVDLDDSVIMQAIVRDISEDRRAEAELIRLRSLLYNIINSMPSVLVGVDLEERVIQWNREAEKLTGVSTENAIGKPLEEVAPGIEVDPAKVRKAMKHGLVEKDSKIVERNGKQPRFLDVAVYPLFSDTVEGAVIRIDDTTDRVLYEEMMIQSEKMFSVGGLAAGMAHEINNPLAGILQNMQVMKKRLEPDLPRNIKAAQELNTTMPTIIAYMENRGLIKMMKAVVESGKRASRIVDNMLGFSRKGQSKASPHDLATLLDKTVELVSNDYNLKKRYDFRTIEIIREYDPTTPNVWCEDIKIQQVMLNLLKNGAEAMAEKTDYGDGEKPCFVLRIIPDKWMVRIEIEDNGPGIEEETQRHIFEPFFTTKDVGVGTGLGLSVSYFIITKNHDGLMSVESTKGKGTRFIIELPIKRSLQ